jgi:hypothetical protein
MSSLRFRGRPLWSLVTLALVVLGSTGCGNDGAGEGTGEPGEVSFELAEQNDANVTGARAVLRYESERRTSVTVDGLDGSERAGPGPNPVRIVRGTCASPGDVAFDLDELAGPSSESTIRVGINELYSGQYALQVLFSDSGSEAMACGELPDRPPG